VKGLNMKKIGLILLCLICLVVVALGKVIVVDVAGGGQYSSIHAAVSAGTTVAGDSILVMSGEYYFTSQLGKVTVSKKLFIIGSGYATVTNGGTKLIDVKGDGLFELDGSSDGTHVSGFRMDSKGNAITVLANARQIVIENNFIIQRTDKYAVSITSSQNDTIRSNIFCAGTDGRENCYGVYLSTATNELVCNNLFAGFKYAYYDPGSTNSKVLNNIFLHNGYYYNFTHYAGVQLTGSSTFSSNVIMSTSHYDVNDGSSGSATITYNCFFNNSYSDDKGYSTIESDPLFKNFASSDVFNETSLEDKEYDFHLNTGSPCINGGIPGQYFDVDGSRNDVGMYGGPYPFNNDLGIPTIPEVISISVSPTSVSPSGSITISATGRIGGGGSAKAAKANPPTLAAPATKTTPALPAAKNSAPEKKATPGKTPKSTR